jgi:hypothetical protein
MENTNAVSIPLVDILSNMLEKRVVMSGDKYIEFDTLKEVPSADIRTAETLKVEKERELSIPKSITARQARRALLNIGKLADVPAAIAKLELPIKEQVEVDWEYATEIYRNNGFIDTLGLALGLNKVALDDLFIAAKNIQ